jgi:hypothetical protein
MQKPVTIPNSSQLLQLLSFFVILAINKSASVQKNIGFITAGVTFIFLIVDRLTR